MIVFDLQINLLLCFILRTLLMTVDSCCVVTAYCRDNVVGMNTFF